MTVSRHTHASIHTRSARLLAVIALLGNAWQPLNAAEPGTFPSAEAAVAALVAAARTDDTTALVAVLGDRADALLDSGDAVADASARARFVEQYDEAHALVPGADGQLTLEVGADGWPSPVPLVKQGEQWAFDTDAGVDEMVYRRIGRNELGAIETLRGIVDAQTDYATESRDGLPAGTYAQRLMSSPDKHDGLYWPTQPDEPASPVGPFVASASAEGYTPGEGEDGGTYHGYRYRLLTSQGASAEGGARDYLEGGLLKGGFAVVAYPASYRVSGVQTFLISHDGVVYQQDLGEDSAKAGAALTTFDPGAGWSKVE